MAYSTIKDGEFTRTIYTMIKDERYNDAIATLINIVDANPTQGDFFVCRLYWAQSLYQAGLYANALKVCNQIANQKLRGKVLKLEAAIRFAEDDLAVAQNAVQACVALSSSNDVDCLVNTGCIRFKEDNYQKALSKFQSAVHMSGFEPQLLYNVAVCHYKMKEYAPAIKCIADIIERGIRDHPELSVGMATEGLDVRSVGNTLSLHKSALVEAFNLKAATDTHVSKRTLADDGAREALTDMPPRLESELDPVTLHNMALLTADANPSGSFDKLQFLLQQQVAQMAQESGDSASGPSACPPETFTNLLLLYCKYEYYDMAADLLAEHADLTYKHLSAVKRQFTNTCNCDQVLFTFFKYVYDFLEALITQQTSPEEAFAKFDALSVRYGDVVRRTGASLKEARRQQNPAIVGPPALAHEQALENFLPILMNQAKIYWDRENYVQVEKLFRQSAELCGDADVWRLNVAHTLFMQENKFREATSFYEPLVKQNYDNILNVSAVVLANLCVCYLVTSQNEEAEELLRKLEKEEEQKSLESPHSKFFHLSIVNLVIGTLYCSKGNFEFGISRVIKSLEPYHQKLGTDTWFYAKRCLMSLLENMAKHVVVIKDSILDDILHFLDSCQFYGREVQTTLENPTSVSSQMNTARFTVTYEARVIKSLLLQIMRM
nr:EOG090X0302 [Moina brachiata]